MNAAKARTGARRSSPNRRRQSSKAVPLWALMALVATVVVALVVVTRPGSDTGAAPAGGERLAHVHGLGMNPADGQLYAATHFGLFQVPGEGNPERVGGAVQDTMGFTVVGPDHFMASGHPDPKDDRLRQPGRPRDPVSLLGAADFHSLVAAHGDVYGYDATSGRFMVSSDGKEWKTRSQRRIGDFAVDPDDGDHLVATVQGGLAESRDGGRSWEPMEVPRQLAFLSELYVAVSRGNGTAIDASVDDGGSWRLRYAGDG